MFGLIVVFEDFRIVLEFLDERQLDGVALGLDDEPHLPARIADADVGVSSSDPSCGVGSSDSPNELASRLGDVQLSEKETDLEIVEHESFPVCFFEKQI